MAIGLAYRVHFLLFATMMALIVGTMPSRVFAASDCLITCLQSEDCDGAWVAAGDVKSRQSFFAIEGVAASVGQIRIGSHLTVTPLKLHVGSSPTRANWVDSERCLARGTEVVVLNIKDVPVPSFGVNQMWLQISLFPSQTLATEPSVQATEKSNGGDSNQAPEQYNGLGVWWEYEVAQASTAYDDIADQTLIQSYNFAIVGPTKVDQAIRGAIERCIKTAALVGHTAFNSAPSPEISARIASAWTAFHTSLESCATIQGIGQAVYSQFEITMINRVRWAKGLKLQLKVTSPMADNYERIHKIVSAQLPEPMNKVISFYISTQKLPEINMTLNPPRSARTFLSTLPKPEKIKAMSESLVKGSRALQKLYKGEISVSAVNDTIQSAKVLATADPDSMVKIQQAYVQLSGEVATEIHRLAPKFADAMLVPQIRNGRLEFGPIKIDPPKVDPQNKETGCMLGWLSCKWWN